MSAPADPSRLRDPERLKDLLDAVLAISSDLSLPAVLQNIVERAIRVVGCRYGALGVLASGGERLVRFHHSGIGPEAARTIGHPPTGKGILGLLITRPEPLRIDDLTRHPERAGFPPGHPDMHSCLGVPIRVRLEVFGLLYLTEKEGGPFTAEDEALAVALAGAAAVAIENARLHDRVRDLTLLEDRDRIAADLHDTVIQRIFATGLALQGTVKAVQPPAAAERIHMAIADLDETIRQIRSTIFALETPRTLGRTTRNEILSLITEAGANLRFEPTLRLVGPVEAMDDGDGASAAGVHLLGALREALTNVVRHAKATRVEVTVTVEDDVVTAEVYDDGVGFDGVTPGPPGAGTGRGLAALAERARDLGGRMEIEPGPGATGTLVRWQIPISR